jgi:hypothetical protein
MTVTVESALSFVQAAAARLSEAVRDLVLTAVEDRPHGNEVHLVTVVHDAALDLAAEAEMTGAVPEGTSLTAVSHAVASCQAHVNAMGALLARELATSERLNDLAVFGRERGREAGAWAKEIIRCIESCQCLLWTDMQPALLGYWNEIIDTDRGASRAPSR